MKKTSLLGLGLLAAILSSCTVEFIIGGGGASIKNISFNSTLKDANGKDYVCFGQNSDLDVAFDASGDLQSWTIKFVGVQTGTPAERTFTVASQGVSKTGVRVKTETQIPSNTTVFSVPSGVKPQAIIVNPTKRGDIALDISITDTSGNSSGFRRVSTTIPMFDCQ